MGWILLIAAIVAEVGATLSLRASITGSRRWYIGVIGGYIAAFVLLSLALAASIPLGVAYGIWAAGGVAITAVLSRVIFKEPLTLLMGTGIALIMGGVLLIELGGVH